MSSQSSANGHDGGTDDEVNLSLESPEVISDHTSKKGVEYNPFGGVNIDLTSFPEWMETKGF